MARIDYYRDPRAPRANSIVVAVTAFVLDQAGRLLMIRRADKLLNQALNRAKAKAPVKPMKVDVKQRELF